MFQDISSYYLEDNKGEHDATELLRLHTVLQRLNDLLKSDNVSQDIKEKIDNPIYKRDIIHTLRYELKGITRPEETFEIWHQHDNLRQYKSYNYSSGDFYDDKYLVKLIQSVIEQHQDRQHDQAHHISDAKKEQMAMTRRLEKKYVNIINPDNTSTDYLRMEFLARTNGSEIIPSLPRSQRFYKYHIHNLTFFLNKSVLDEKWDLAYKIFCIILRIPSLDLRLVWSIGINILQGKMELTNNVVTKQFLKLKQQSFFTWLNSFYVLKIRKPLSNVTNPVFRSGSKSHVPLYFITSLWSLISSKDYKKVIDILDGVILRSPYDTEGCLPFILCLSYLMETTQLITVYGNADQNLSVNDDSMSLFSSRSDVYAKITDNFLKVAKNLRKCDALNFIYPKELIDDQIDYIKNKLKEIDEGTVNELEVDITVTNGIQETEDDTRYINNSSIEKFNSQDKTLVDEEQELTMAEEGNLKPSQIPSDEEIIFSDEDINDDIQVPLSSQIPSDIELEFSDDETVNSDYESIDNEAIQPTTSDNDFDFDFSD